MPKASIDKFIKALDSARLNYPTRTSNQPCFARQVPSIPVTQLESVLDTLYGLYYVRELSGVKRSTFLQDFMDGIQDVPELAVGAKDRDGLQLG